MGRQMIDDARAEAVFASTLQRADGADAVRIRAAVRDTVRRYRTLGCRALVAQEFGERPETAVSRMRWAREAVRTAYHCPR